MILQLPRQNRRRSSPSGLLLQERVHLQCYYRGVLDQRKGVDTWAEEAHPGADHRQAAGGGGRAGQGQTIAEVCRKLGVTEQTYYRWRKEYGGLRIDQAKRLKELEQENARLKKLVADLSLDKAILKEAAPGNF